jgi:VacB/RNase II family 3'-5' exoribonuclease
MGRKHDRPKGSYQDNSGHPDLHFGAFDLAGRAKIEMLAAGFTPVFEPEALEQANHLPHKSLVGIQNDPKVRDLRTLLWSSIDNVESRDLDQIEYAERLPDGTVRVLVGIADVDAYVTKGTPIDQHAAHNTTSVYTGIVTFPMLPEQLSFDLTSLLPDQDRRAMVIELIVDKDGKVVKSDAYQAIVCNRAKLDYISVGNWLAGGGAPPQKVADVQGLEKQLRLQSEVKERIHTLRDEHGSLTLHTPEATTIAKDGQVLDLELVETNPARELIENFMIAANIATSQFLEAKGAPTIRRIVKTPDRWPRIVEVAAEYGEKLPDAPSAQALSQFLIKRRNADALRFPDLSLTIVKLLGRGEYVVEVPGQRDEGHFALAVNDYTHATAPNRRYADLVTQRSLKAVMAGTPIPYTLDELNDAALACTQRESAEKKVERTMRKISAAILLSKHIGQKYDGIVTGVKDNAVYIRLIKPPVDGCITRGGAGLDVGDQVKVELIHVDPEKSHIDFALTGKIADKSTGDSSGKVTGKPTGKSTGNSGGDSSGNKRSQS